MTNDVGAKDRENGGPFVSNHLRDMLKGGELHLKDGMDRREQGA